MNEFIQVTTTEGNKLYVRKDMIASVGTWLGKTQLTLTIDEVDYEVKETPEQVLKLIKGEQNVLRNTKHRNPARKQLTCTREDRSKNN